MDALYRDHAEVEDRAKAIKRVGLGLLSSKSWQLNVAWVLAAAIVADVGTWTRILLLRDELELAAAETETIRRKLYHLPARLAMHARRRILHLDPSWPGRRPSARPVSTSQTSRPSPDGRPRPPRKTRADDLPHHPRPVEPGAAHQTAITAEESRSLIWAPWPANPGACAPSRSSGRRRRLDTGPSFPFGQISSKTPSQRPPSRGFTPEGVAKGAPRQVVRVYINHLSGRRRLPAPFVT